MNRRIETDILGYGGFGFHANRAVRVICMLSHERLGFLRFGIAAAQCFD